MVNISLDLHGVIDRDPETFREIAHTIWKKGGEATIISGCLPETLLSHLLEYKVVCTRWVSATKFLLNRGYSWDHDKHHRPSFDIAVWNLAKAKIIR